MIGCASEKRVSKFRRLPLLQLSGPGVMASGCLNIGIVSSNPDLGMCERGLCVVMRRWRSHNGLILSQEVLLSVS